MNKKAQTRVIVILIAYYPTKEISSGNNNQDARPSTVLRPIIVNPTISCVSLSYLANIPEPKSIVNAVLDSPNDIYNTSASLSYSQSTFLGFSTFNVSSIISPDFVVCLNNKLSEQNRYWNVLLYILPQGICSEIQVFSEISLWLKEFLHLPSAPYLDYLLFQESQVENLSSHDALQQYAENVLPIALLEHCSLKSLSSFNLHNLANFINIFNSENE